MTIGISMDRGDLSDSWTGFTQFTLLGEKPPDVYICGPGERLTRRQLTSRPDYLWPELWGEIGKKCKAEGEAESGQLKNQSSIMLEDYEEFISLTLRTRNSKKPSRMLARKLETPVGPAMHRKTCKKSKRGETRGENARKWRGIYFIDPEDTEFKETIKNARKQLETSVAPAMPCKIMKNCGSGASNQNLRVFWKPVNPQECVWKNLYRNIMRTILQKKGDNSLQHYYNLVHKFTPMPQAMKIPAAKAAVDKEWEKIGKDFRRGT